MTQKTSSWSKLPGETCPRSNRVKQPQPREPEAHQALMSFALELLSGLRARGVQAESKQLGVTRPHML